MKKCRFCIKREILKFKRLNAIQNQLAKISFYSLTTNFLKKTDSIDNGIKQNKIFMNKLT